MRLNTPKAKEFIRPKTHEGAPAAKADDLTKLRRSVMSCLLWEDSFYEDGQSIVDRISECAAKVTPVQLANTAIEARMRHNLRHVPLLLCSLLAKYGAGSSIVSETIDFCIQRADELTELLTVHAKLNKVPPNALKPVVSAQMKKGIASAFRKFDEYQLRKYDRDGPVRLRDAMFLTHPKPMSVDQAMLWKRLIDGNMAIPDTWETNLSAGHDKKETFTRLLEEGKLGYMALLRNLRGMSEAGVDSNLIEEAIVTGAEGRGAQKILPFRFIAAIRACPQFSAALDYALCARINSLPELSGRTVVLVDVSGSMSDRLSRKSELSRMDAAAGLASILNCEHLRVFTFSNEGVEVPPRRGLTGINEIVRSQPPGGTRMFEMIDYANRVVAHDRIIVITDEQSMAWGRRGCPDPVVDKAYMLNVGVYENGVGYGRWLTINGFSENVIRYIHEYERVTDV